MDEPNISAILAFYNLLAAKIGLEDCRSLKEVRNLMPILANYMKFGAPNFVDDPNFGFRNGVDLIASELDEEFYSQLNSDSAESGDDFEAVKIHMAMIYTFRLLQTEAFSAICQQLEDKHQRRFAYMVECLDDRHRWTFAPWSKLLSTDQQNRMVDNEHKDSGEDKENDNEGVELRRVNSLSLAQTPRTNSTRRLPFPIGSSPILKVVSSPRGKEVVRIHALEREVKSLREIRDFFGREKDRAEEICQQKETENSNLQKKIQRLQAQVSVLLPSAERVPLLEEQLLSMEAQDASMTKQLHDAQQRASSAEKFAGELKFELRKMDIRQEHLEKQVADQQTTMRMANDESDTVEQLRKELLEAQHQNSVHLSTIRELQIKLDSREREFISRLNDKDQEKETYWKMMDECKARSEENMQRSSDEAKKVQEEKRALERELAESKRLNNDQLELAEHHKELIAGLDRDRAEHDEIRQERDALRKQLMEREHYCNSEMERLRKSAREIERERSQAKQQMDELKKLNSKITRAHYAEVASLQRKNMELQRALKAAAIAQKVAENEQRNAKPSQQDVQHQKHNDTEQSQRPSRKMNRTQSMSVTFVPCSSAAVSCDATLSSAAASSDATLSSVTPSCDATLSGQNTTNVNDDERLHELRERNKRYPPHMRSNYLPESAHLRNSDTDLNIMP